MRTLIASLAMLPLLIAVPRAATVTTVIGTGTAGLSDTEVANPYGVVIGPDGSPIFGASGSSSATPNSAWDSEI